MLYFDTSFIAPLILNEATSDKIEAFFAKQSAGQLYVSHWTRVEFASLIAREVRMGGLAEQDALLAIGQFDEMVAESFQVLMPGVAEFELAKTFIARFETKLRAGDALHLSIAKNHGAALYTLDEGMLSAGRKLKVQVNQGIRK